MENFDIEKLNIAIIGGTGGIGRALTQTMVQQGARLTIVGQTFRDSELSNLKFIKADLSLMNEARRVGKLLIQEDFDIYIFTTGIMAAPSRQETLEGLERDIAISYLSRLVIIRTVCSHLVKTMHNRKAKPRFFIMGYPGKNQIGKIDDLNAEKAYSAISVHMNTVAGNEILVMDSAQRYLDVNFYGLNPGIIRTNIRDNLLGVNTMKSYWIEKIIEFLNPSAKDYAERIVPLLLSNNIEEKNGYMFSRKARLLAPSKLLTKDYIDEFITASENLVSKVIPEFKN